MLYSGVSWNSTGYRVLTVTDAGWPLAPQKGFAAGAAQDMIGYLASLGRRHAVVIDSTNGILDGRMMAAGLTVYRADPRHLPSRPKFGSVPAADLAEAARRDLSALVRLDRGRGTQTGRETDIDAGIAASEMALRALIAQGRCLSNGDRGSRQIALTFDDGPLPPYTDQILDILDRYEVTATFFCVGLNVRAYPDQVRRIRTAGHAVGNHTWSHPFLPELSRPQLGEQIERTSAMIESVSGEAPAFFRPPYGTRSPQVLQWLAEFRPTITLWDVEPFDWSMPGAETITKIVLDQARPGSIILLHDGGGDRSQTVASLPPMIEGLLRSGFSFVPIETLASRAATPPLAHAK